MSKIEVSLLVCEIHFVDFSLVVNFLLPCKVFLAFVTICVQSIQQRGQSPQEVILSIKNVLNPGVTFTYRTGEWSPEKY